MGHARHHHVAAGFIKGVNNLARKKKTELNTNLAIAYYRFSSHSQNKASIEQQRELSHSWAGAHEFNIVMEHNGTACLEGLAKVIEKGVLSETVMECLSALEEYKAALGKGGLRPRTCAWRCARTGTASSRISTSSCTPM